LQECLVFDKTSGREYNLGALQQTRNANWVAENNDAEFEFLINVCECVRPTVSRVCVAVRTTISILHKVTFLARYAYTPFSLYTPCHLTRIVFTLPLQVPPTGCDPTAGVCQLKLADGKTPEIHNLGGLDPASPLITDTGLELHYLNGDQCGTGVTGKFRSTVINMQCNHSASMDQVPVYIGELIPCEYTFNWSTPAACSTERVSGNDDGTIKVSAFRSLYGYSMSLQGNSSDSIFVAASRHQPHH
jgi:hypothetical protein